MTERQRSGDVNRLEERSRADVFFFKEGSRVDRPLGFLADRDHFASFLCSSFHLKMKPIGLYMLHAFERKLRPPRLSGSERIVQQEAVLLPTLLEAASPNGPRLFFIISYLPE